MAFSLLLLPFALGRGSAFAIWAGLGWLIAVATGVGTGNWLEWVHGTPGTGFLKAFGTCMLSRSVAYAVGGLVAVSQGHSALWAYLTGLAVGYVATQSFEVFWFARKTWNDHGPQAARPGS